MQYIDANIRMNLDSRYAERDELLYFRGGPEVSEGGVEVSFGEMFGGILEETSGR